MFVPRRDVRLRSILFPTLRNSELNVRFRYLTFSNFLQALISRSVHNVCCSEIVGIGDEFPITRKSDFVDYFCEDSI